MTKSSTSQKLKSIWLSIPTLESNSVKLESLWPDIQKQHEEPHRHYHNLDHLAYMFDALQQAETKAKDLDVLSIAIFYHDIVYSVTAKENEHKSALWAQKDLDMLGIDASLISKVMSIIEATKSHEESNTADVNLMLDLDLAILGDELHIYQAYAKKVRSEYSIYPDLLYIPGRKKVLKHFLSLPSIFKTQEFISQRESQAKNNLQWELDNLA